MVHEPLVIVVKLGDRLHNMRTARPPPCDMLVPRDLSSDG